MSNLARHMTRGKPKTAGGGRHDYTNEESLAYWQRRWKAEFDALPEHQRRERVTHIRERLRGAPRRSPLRDLAQACGIEETDDDE